MSNVTFLMDANAFITPYQQYYPFDLAPIFWANLKDRIEKGSIAILDMVKNELLQGYDGDPLREWISDIRIKRFVDHRNGEILANYSRVLQYVQSCGFYTDSGLASWSKDTVADPWLIATSMAMQYPIVTFEVAVNRLDVNTKTKRVRIPDVSAHFGVEVVSLFDMMRSLDMKMGK